MNFFCRTNAFPVQSFDDYGYCGECFLKKKPENFFETVRVVNECRMVCSNT